MPKMKLDPESLRVDTFLVTPEFRDRNGTVLAHSPSYTFGGPYSFCTSENETTPDSNCCTGEEQMQTCNHTVCDCDQEPPETFE